MPNRILYSSLLHSQKVSTLKSQEFELYIRLLLVADDFGRFSGHPVRIARSCWPDREDITGKIVEPLLAKLNTAGLIVQYAANAEKCIQITGWNQRTRQMTSKYPPPDSADLTDGCQMTVSCQPDDSHMLTETETETETETVSKAPIHTHGSQGNVKLTDEEIDRLNNDYSPGLVSEAIEFLSLYIVDKGDKSKAKTHNATLRRWVFDAVQEKKAKQPRKEPVVQKYHDII